MARRATSLQKLRDQIDAYYIGRDKASDGWIGDPRHRALKSDHNPNRFGVVQAIDVDEDVSQGADAMPLVRALVASRDRRIKYIIYEGKMIRSYKAKNGAEPWTWTKYSGTNPHNHHFHISVVDNPALYDDDSAWDLSAITASTPPQQPELKLGDKGESVKRLQLALRAHGYEIDADGDFGKNTEKAVKGFQIARNLRSDGIAGRNTNAALGLN